MPDDFHAYRQNYPSGVTDRDIEERFGGNQLDDEEIEQSEVYGERDTTNE